MPEIIANPPWYLPVIFALIAVALISQGNSRQIPRLKWAGVILALVSAGIFTLSSILESEQEKVVRQTIELSDSVDKRDWKKFERFLDPNVIFDRYKGRETLVEGANRTITIADVKNITLGNISIKSDPGEYVVNFTATAEIAEAGRRVPTNWRFYWAKPSNQSEFLLYRIEYVPSDQLGELDVKSRLK